MDLKSIVLALLMCMSSTLAGEDFYERLGVHRGATDKEIRKAFKKLAVTMHPDKNPDDPDAHNNFLKITRAYEVLKDEDLRKKFDEHGEEGLSENFGKKQYESWSFYQNEFGIYDDDPEIITLSRTDFETSVEGTDDIWFVNFYSPHCSHCHHLAPDWRLMAQELEGVIRVGAVNCEDQWQLCQRQRIPSYPSLMMYPGGKKYHGGKSRKELVKFALQHVNVKALELWSGNFDELVTNTQSDLPWVISFCGEGGDCVSSSTALKLAAMMDELANVATMDCHGNNQKKCESLGREYGTYFFQPGQIEKGEGMEMDSLNAQEIANQVLSLLPDVTDLDQAMFQGIQEKLKSGQEDTWLVHFVEGDEGRLLELRKLPAMLPDMKVGRIDCQVMREMCNDLHIIKFPSFYIFKQAGGHEIYYGRVSAHDVAAFARDSAFIKVEALGPSDFDSRRVGPSSDDLWFVDFFAPWCPPCMRLLPEFRKAAKSFGNVVNFGTVDCTIHQNLCQLYNVHSYPTTIFYNHTVPVQFKGQHNERAIIEFIEDTLNPPVIILDPESYERMVNNKPEDQIWLIDFFASWCGPCQQLAPEWRRLAKMMKNTPNVRVAQVDCHQHGALCTSQGVRSYPNIRIYTTGNSYHIFNGFHRNAATLRSWASDFLPSKLKTVTWHMFQSDIVASPDPWVLDFFAPWCGHCQTFKPEFENVATILEGQVTAGKVDCTQEQHLCQRAGVREYPTIRLYKGSPNGQAQNMYGMDINSQNADDIVRFIRDNTPNLQDHKKKHDEL